MDPEARTEWGANDVSSEICYSGPVCQDDLISGRRHLSSISSLSIASTTQLGSTAASVPWGTTEMPRRARSTTARHVLVLFRRTSKNSSNIYLLRIKEHQSHLHSTITNSSLSFAVQCDALYDMALPAEDQVHTINVDLVSKLFFPS